MIDFIHSYGKFIIAGVVAVIILTTVGAVYYYNVLYTAEDDYAPKSLLDDYSYKEYENTNIRVSLKEGLRLNREYTPEEMFQVTDKNGNAYTDAKITITKITYNKEETPPETENGKYIFTKKGIYNVCVSVRASEHNFSKIFKIIIG